MNSNGHGLVDPKRKGCSRKQCFSPYNPEIRKLNERLSFQVASAKNSWPCCLAKRASACFCNSSWLTGLVLEQGGIRAVERMAWLAAVGAVDGTQKHESFCTPVFPALRRSSGGVAACRSSRVEDRRVARRQLLRDISEVCVVLRNVSLIAKCEHALFLRKALHACAPLCLPVQIGRREQHPIVVGAMGRQSEHYLQTRQWPVSSQFFVIAVTFYIFSV